MNVSVIDKLALVYLDQEGRLLLTRSKGKQTLFLPGGKRDPGESDIQALVREAKEELNVDVDPTSAKLIGTFCAQADGKPLGTQVRLICYTAAFTGTPVASSEIESLAWITSHQIEDCSTAARLVVEALMTRGLLKETLNKSHAGFTSPGLGELEAHNCST